MSKGQLPQHGSPSTARLVAGRFTFIDGLRGIAAMAVTVFHAYEGNHISDLMIAMPGWVQWVVMRGHLGVAIFFVLSGFVISHSLRKQALTMRFVGEFFIRRSIRLNPPYWFAIALVIGFGAISAYFVKGKLPPAISLAQVMAHAFYLQEVLGYNELNPIFWTLCQEMQFYLAYALLLALTKNDPGKWMQGKATTIGLALAALISLLWPLEIATAEPWRGSFLPLWYCFLLGAGPYWSWRYPGIRNYYLTYALILLLSGILHGNELTVACSLMSLGLWYATRSRLVYTGLDWRGMQWLGAISYSLYLTHNTISGAAYRIGFSITGKSVASELFWFLATSAVCIAFASAVWWLVEKPSMAFARRITLSSEIGKGVKVATD